MTESASHQDRGPLTDTEIEFLRANSGTRPDREELYRARAWMSAHRDVVRMPDVPYIDEICRALPYVGVNARASAADAFVENARIDLPDSDRTMTVRAWLESGGDFEPVLELARSLRRGI